MTRFYTIDSLFLPTVHVLHGLGFHINTRTAPLHFLQA